MWSFFKIVQTQIINKTELMEVIYSFCAAQNQMTHGPVPVRGSGVGDLCIRVKKVQQAKLHHTPAFEKPFVKIMRTNKKIKKARFKMNAILKVQAVRSALRAREGSPWRRNA